MSTDDMPTTNQGKEDATFADRIPETTAEAFQKVTNKAVNAAFSSAKQAVNDGMNAGISN